MAPIETGTVMVDGVSAFFRRVRGEGPPAVFVHGNPTDSADWQPFLERIEGPAVAFDLPGWAAPSAPPASTTRWTASRGSSAASCSGWRSRSTRSSFTIGARSR